MNAGAPTIALFPGYGPKQSANLGQLALVQFFPVPSVVFAELGTEVHYLVGKKFVIGQEHDGLVLIPDLGAEAPDVPLHLHGYFPRRVVFVDPEKLVGLVCLVVGLHDKLLLTPFTPFIRWSHRMKPWCG